MLVGFCLAVKRKALGEVGLLDENFGLGTYEDNDICYRLRRAGYRLVRSAKAFIHHEGSKTMKRMNLDYELLDSGCCGMAGGFAESMNQILDPEKQRFKVHTAFNFVQSPSGSITAQRVVLAAGVWSPRLAHDLEEVQRALQRSTVLRSTEQE